jgi:hypothetical protein
MSLRQWEANGWLRREPVSPAEISNLRAIVRRDLQDARGEVSPDWRFGIAYNAALKLCAILLRAEGYRPAHGLQHYRTIQAMPLILGSHRTNDATYLDACRVKRNEVEYDYVGGASDRDADELIEFAADLREDVEGWLRGNHPDLMTDARDPRE